MEITKKIEVSREWKFQHVKSYDLPLHRLLLFCALFKGIHCAGGVQQHCNVSGIGKCKYIYDSGYQITVLVLSDATSFIRTYLGPVKNWFRICTPTVRTVHFTNSAWLTTVLDTPFFCYCLGPTGSYFCFTCPFSVLLEPATVLYGTYYFTLAR